MKNKNINILLIIIIITITVVAILQIKKITNKPLKILTNNNKAVPIEYYSVKKGEIKNSISFNGLLEYFEEGNIVAKRSGFIEDISFDEGEQITKKATFATLDEKELFLNLEKLKHKLSINQSSINKIKLQKDLLKKQNQVNSISMIEIENSIKSIKFEINSTNINLENIRKDYERNKTLYKEKAVSKSQFENIETKYLSLKENLKKLKIKEENTLLNKKKNLSEKDQILINIEILDNILIQSEQELEITKVDIENLKLQISYSRIISNYSGVVIKKHKDSGELAKQGASLATIGVNDTMKAIINIPLETAVKLDNSSNAILSFDSTDKKFTANFSKIDTQINSSTGLARVEFTVDNKEKLFKKNMSVIVEIIDEIEDSSMIIPTRALINKDNEAYVFVLEDKVAKLTKVNTGINNSNYTEIISGLDVNTKIALTGISELENNSKVYLIKEGE